MSTEVTQRFMQIHLDPLGGWSGDMFVAALLDAFPMHWPQVEAAIASLDLGNDAASQLVPHQDGILAGMRFMVAAERTHHDHRRHDASHHARENGDQEQLKNNHHTAWIDIRNLLRTSKLDPAVAQHAINIFALLAEAEAKVHGCSQDQVEFHEVGAIDSIVDIVAAAQLITLVNATRWTSSPLPLGSGQVMTSHGPLPVPSPATVLLLQGMMTSDDGVVGERVTPTGAAIARYLLKDPFTRLPTPRLLAGTGIGFGSRSLGKISNCLRVLAFDETDLNVIDQTQGEIKYRQLAVINFEVDDQTGEDLSHGLDHVRMVPGVHDVIQSFAIGKKGRMATHIQVLVSPADLAAAINACFDETTTIGLRYDMVSSAVLTRRHEQADVGSHRLNVKLVKRPSGGMTAKTEADDVGKNRGQALRATLRTAGEVAAIEKNQTPTKREVE